MFSRARRIANGIRAALARSLPRRSLAWEESRVLVLRLTVLSAMYVDLRCISSLDQGKQYCPLGFRAVRTVLLPDSLLRLSVSFLSLKANDPPLRGVRQDLRTVIAMLGSQR